MSKFHLITCAWGGAICCVTEDTETGACEAVTVCGTWVGTDWLMQDTVSCDPGWLWVGWAVMDIVACWAFCCCSCIVSRICCCCCCVSCCCCCCGLGAITLFPPTKINRCTIFVSELLRYFLTLILFTRNRRKTFLYPGNFKPFWHDKYDECRESYHLIFDRT